MFCSLWIKMIGLCKLCDKQCGNIPALNRHVQWKHTELKDKFKCTICEKYFRSSVSLEKHNRAHEKGAIRSRATYKCPLCSNCGFDKTKINKHFEEAHSIEIGNQTLTFHSQDLFEKWKQDIEFRTMTKYVKHRAPTTNKDGFVSCQYYCHRDGYFTPSGIGVRPLKKLGTNKIDGHCPSMIDVVQVNGSVYVNYIETHVGHSNDLDRLSKTQKKLIAGQLAKKISVEDTHQISVSQPEERTYTESNTRIVEGPCVGETSGLDRLSKKQKKLIAKQSAKKMSVEDTHQISVSESEERTYSESNTRIVQGSSVGHANDLDRLSKKRKKSIAKRLEKKNSVEDSHQISVSQLEERTYSESNTRLVEGPFAGHTSDLDRLSKKQKKLIAKQLAKKTSVEDTHQISVSEPEERTYSESNTRIVEGSGVVHANDLDRLSKKRKTFIAKQLAKKTSVENTHKISVSEPEERTYSESNTRIVEGSGVVHANDLDRLSKKRKKLIAKQLVKKTSVENTHQISVSEPEERTYSESNTRIEEGLSVGHTNDLDRLSKKLIAKRLAKKTSVEDSLQISVAEPEERTYPESNTRIEEGLSVGHTNDLDRLSKKQKKLIAKRLAKKTSVEDSHQISVAEPKERAYSESNTRIVEGPCVGHASDLDRLSKKQKKLFAKRLAKKMSVEDTHQISVSEPEERTYSENNTRIVQGSSVVNANDLDRLSKKRKKLIAKRLAKKTSVEDSHQISVSQLEERTYLESNSDDLLTQNETQNDSFYEQLVKQNFLEGAHDLSCPCHMYVHEEECLSETRENIVETQYADQSYDLDRLNKTQKELTAKQLTKENSIEDTHHFLVSESEGVTYSESNTRTMEVPCAGCFNDLFIQNETQNDSFYVELVQQNFVEDTLIFHMHIHDFQCQHLKMSV